MDSLLGRSRKDVLEKARRAVRNRTEFAVRTWQLDKPYLGQNALPALRISIEGLNCETQGIGLTGSVLRALLIPA
jgi:hypothetical protein